MAMIELAGRKALVTGGARGIGATVAAALSKAGAWVMLGDILDEVGETTSTELSRGNAKVHFTHLDVTDEASWETAVAATISQLGGFDILINNAGVEVTALVADIDPAELRRMLDVNVVGTALGMKYAFRAMRPDGAAGKGGAIVNVASVAAIIAFPSISGYSATKSAVDRMTKIAAVESGRLGYGVRVNCVYPGLVPTDMGMKLANDIVALGLAPSLEGAIGDVVAQTPMGRLAAVEEIADPIVFLCSDAARFMTGAGLPIDGGMGI